MTCVVVWYEGDQYASLVTESDPDECDLEDRAALVATNQAHVSPDATYVWWTTDDNDPGAARLRPSTSIDGVVLREGRADWPTRLDVATELSDIVEQVDFDEVEVRLQISDDGWRVHWGDPGYDTDHRGHWGAGTLSRTRDWDDLLSLAGDLLGQCLESDAEGDL